MTVLDSLDVSLYKDLGYFLGCFVDETNTLGGFSDNLFKSQRFRFLTHETVGFSHLR